MRFSFSITLMLLAFQGSLAGAVRYFPQVANGVAGSIQSNTAFFFVNTGDAATLTLAFRKDSGEPLNVTPFSLGSDSDFELSLAAGEAIPFETEGKGNLPVGYAYFDSPQSVRAREYSLERIIQARRLRMRRESPQWISQRHEFPAPFDQKFHLLLNLAVGGKWPGPPNSETQFPQTFEIDYVRVYQRTAAD